MTYGIIEIKDKDGDPLLLNVDSISLIMLCEDGTYNLYWNGNLVKSITEESYIVVRNHIKAVNLGAKSNSEELADRFSQI